MATAEVVVPWQPWRAWRTTALWTATAHLAIGVVFTSVCAALVVTGVAVGAVLLITAGAGVVWRLGTPMMTSLGSAERARFQIMLGLQIPGTDGALSSIRCGVRYWCTRLPVSLLDLVGLLVAWVVPLGAMSVPIVVRSYGTSWVAFGCGLAALLFVSPVVTRFLLDVDIALATKLLGPRPDDLRTRVRSLETSRAGVVAADDRERRRIERDLHDGAQQRLVALNMVLGRAQRRLGDDADPAIRALLAEAKANAGEAITELRELARGLHPPVLTDRGLDAALSAVAARLPVPVTIHVVTEPRPSPTIEAIAYFVVSEALANVAKHAQATRAAVIVQRRGDRLLVQVSDDGIGGANANAGSGIAGLRDRVGGVDGTLEITSPAGGPTTLAVEMPCGS